MTGVVCISVYFSCFPAHFARVNRGCPSFYGCFITFLQMFYNNSTTAGYPRPNATDRSLLQMGGGAVGPAGNSPALSRFRPRLTNHATDRCLDADCVSPLIGKE